MGSKGSLAKEAHCSMTRWHSEHLWLTNRNSEAFNMPIILLKKASDAEKKEWVLAALHEATMEAGHLHTHPPCFISCRVSTSSYTSSSQSTQIKCVFLAILCDLFGGGRNVTPIQRWIVTSNDHLVDVYSIRTLRGAIFTHEAHAMQGEWYWGWLHIDLIWYSKTILPKLTSIICMTPNARNPKNFSSAGSFFAQSLSMIEPKQIR